MAKRRLPIGIQTLREVRAGGHVYLFEFKVTEQAGSGTALAQLRERGYAAKYRAWASPFT